jgi:tetratricopeptide (TPR) repeat protein
MIDDQKKKIGAFLKCIQLDQHNPISLYFLANVYIESNRFLPAIQLYLKGIEANPLDIKSYYGLVLCLLNMAIKGFNNQEDKIVT